MILALVGCGRAFDQAAWQNPGCDVTGSENCSARHDMLGSVKKMFPEGAKEADVMRALGRPDRCTPSDELSTCWWATEINEKITFAFRDGKVHAILVQDIF